MRREILDMARSTGYEGSVLDLYQMANQGANVTAMLQAESQAKQENMLVAQTPQEQQVGLREQHAMGNTDASMVFPDVAPNTAFNTEGMKVPINISKMDEQGHLVQSYQNVPPGIKNLPTGPKRGTVIETPAYQDGGMRGMMKAKIAMENQFGNNPAITRMIKPTDKSYDFGDGDTGTHHMGSYGKFAIPSIQDVDGTLQYTGPRKDEAIKFDRVEDATYFAENYKDVAPALRTRKKGGTRDPNPREYSLENVEQPTGKDKEAVISKRTFDAFKNLDVVKDSYNVNRFYDYSNADPEEYAEYDGKLVYKDDMQRYLTEDYGDSKMDGKPLRQYLLDSMLDYRNLDKEDFIGKDAISRYEDFKDEKNTDYRYENQRQSDYAPLYKAMDKILPKLDTLSDTEVQEFTGLINNLSSPYTKAMSENEDFGATNALRILANQDLSGIKKYREKMGLSKDDVLDLIQPPEDANKFVRGLTKLTKRALKLKTFQDGGYNTLGFLSASLPEKLKIASGYAAKAVSDPVRKKIADNLYPISYGDGLFRIINAVRGKKDPRDKRTGTKEDSKRMQESTDFLRIHMGQDQKYESIPKSKYKPSIAKDDDVTYYSSPVTEEAIRENIDYLSDQKSFYTNEEGSKRRGTNMGGVLGRYTITKGEDEKGKYVSYYDKWDFNPFDYNKYPGGESLSKAYEKTMGFFGMNAPEIYGRVYYDEKTGKAIRKKGGYRSKYVV